MNDDLPDPESMADVWDNLPSLAPPLIDGVLRQGHKMLIAGPSKAGKSYALIELCCAIAEGKKWLEWNCTQGKVMYVNLELDRASCLHRFKDVYTALGIAPSGETVKLPSTASLKSSRSEERRVGKECRSRWSPYH